MQQNNTMTVAIVISQNGRIRLVEMEEWDLSYFYSTAGNLSVKSSNLNCDYTASVVLDVFTCVN
jgi:hypothetical protein